MKGEQTFPFRERADYDFDIWITDLLNLIKKRSLFIDDKEKAFHVFVDNAAEFTEMYADGFSPTQAFEDFNE